MKKIRRNRTLSVKFIGEEISVRNKIVQMLFLLIFLGIMLKMFHLQVILEDKYTYLSKNNRIKLKKIDAPRGKIFDRTGKLVVTNGTGYRLVYLNERDEKPEIIKEIANLTGYSEEFVIKKIRYGEIFPYTRENVLIENLDRDLAHRMLEKIGKYPYLQIQPYSQRRYIYDAVASHIIGFVKKISSKEYEELQDEGYGQKSIVGKNGLEKEYERELVGENGYKYLEVNAFSKVENELPSKRAFVPGKDLYMTINMELQMYMEEQFKKGNKVGAFIALNPKNGEIITMVSYPTYSLSMRSSNFSQEEWDKLLNDPRKPLYNKAISGEYPPGSVFKVISAMAFLNNRIDPNEKYKDYTGYYQIGDWVWRAWKKGGHGDTDMKKSLVESANTYYYNYSDKIGHKSIEEVSKTFGLGQKVGIDILGEKTGVLPTDKWIKAKKRRTWYKGDTILMSIGQGDVLTTPLQIAKIYSIIANKGYFYQPHLVKEFRDGENNRYPFVMKKEQIGKYPKKYYDFINDALIATVEQNNGTTTILRTPGVKVAAKSGSAQNSQSKETHAWVAGYFPANNPEIVFTAILEGAGSGGAVAGNLTKQFIKKYFEIKKRDNGDTLITKEK